MGMYVCWDIIIAYPHLCGKERIYERKEKQKKVRNHLQCKDIISVFAK